MSIPKKNLSKRFLFSKLLCFLFQKAQIGFNLIFSPNQLLLLFFKNFNLRKVKFLSNVFYQKKNEYEKNPLLKRVYSFYFSKSLVDSIKHLFCKDVILFIFGMTGFEPATPGTQSRCATKLRYIPFFCFFTLCYDIPTLKSNQPCIFDYKNKMI